MIKRISIIVIVLGVLAGVIYEYLHLRKKELPVSTAITAIPIDASFIFESRDTYPLWKGVSGNSLIWKDLLSTEAVTQLNHSLQYLDSIIGEDSKMHGIVETEPIFVSAQLNGMDHYDFLFVCSIPVQGGEEGLNGFMQGLGKKGSLTQIQYDGINVYNLKQPGRSDFSYAIHSGIFIGSLNEALVQESLRQMESGISLLNSVHFKKVLDASGGQSEAELFVSCQTLSNVISSFMSKNFHSTLLSLPDFAQWFALDVTYTPNEIIMNGFTDADSTGGEYISLFEHQSAQSTRVPSIIPANTAFMDCFEISDRAAFVKDYKKYLGLHRRIYKHNDWVENIQKVYNINIEKNFYSWLDNEFALVITEPSDSTLQNDTYAIIGAHNIKDAENALGRLSDSVKGPEEKHFATVQYMKHDIKYIGVEYMLYNLLGGTYEPLKHTYYTTISNYVVFANSPEALQMFINRYESGYTLEKDSYYRSFISDHVESESQIYIYNNVALSPMLYEQYVDKTYADAIKKHTDIIRKTQAIGIQFNFMQGMFYTDVYVKRNPEYKKQAGALWQVALDTTIAGHPYWVTDHKTKYQYVFVQDKADNIYLISNTGHIQWKKEAEARIISPVYSIDVMRNGKCQYLFNTAKSIDIVDRNGKDMYGFPVNIPNKASGPVTCFDYEKNRKYRLLAPCTDGKLRMYDIGGKSVKEWVSPETDAPVTTTARHIKVDDKDYIIVVDEHGKVYGFDRKGKSRLTLQQRLPEHMSKFYLQEGKRLDDTYMFAADSMGIVYQLSLTDVMTHTQYVSAKNERFDFAPVDLDGKGNNTMLFLSHYDLYAYNLDKTKLFHYSVRDSVTRNMVVFKYIDGKARIGAVDTKNNKIYIWDEQGNLCNGFPLYGSTEFEIADMNADGQLYLVTGASDGNVYVYSLP
jgi:hypothetical protein